MGNKLIFLFFIIIGLINTWEKQFDQLPIITPELVSRINSLTTSWKASSDQGYIANMTRNSIKKILGTKLHGGPKLPSKIYNIKETELPTEFDSRTNWPDCPTIKQIRDQANCGSCWAFGAVEAMSDRYCTYFKKNIEISSEDLLTCCGSCGFGCDGGYPSAAWLYWTSNGLVTEACSPYAFPSCDHHLPNSSNPCPDVGPTPPCVKKCKNSADYTKDKHFGATSYTINGATDMMNEIYNHGPIEAAFSVYEDFLTYKSGVYRHTTGGFLGGHAIKILGWGVENNLPYWLVANSWNENWGDKGYFKILRGKNECGIERGAVAGAPKN
jgi:cathepsin B